MAISHAISWNMHNHIFTVGHKVHFGGLVCNTDGWRHLAHWISGWIQGNQFFETTRVVSHMFSDHQLSKKGAVYASFMLSITSVALIQLPGWRAGCPLDAEVFSFRCQSWGCTLSAPDEGEYPGEHQIWHWKIYHFLDDLHMKKT